MPISDKLLSCAACFSPNEHEAAIIADHAIRVDDGINFDDVKEVAEKFRARGVDNLIITMAGMALLLLTRTEWSILLA